MSIRGIRNRLKSHLAAQGFTLVEIMVAVLLLLFAMAGIVPFFLGGLSQASSVRYKSVATNIARERIEQIRQLDYREITEDSDEGVTLTERYGSTAEYTTAERPLTFDVSYAVEESIYDSGILKRVTVNVAWDAPPALSAASITTMIHQQFLGPRGSLLEVTPVSPDPLGSPFSLVAGTTKVRYHITESDWGLLFSNLDPANLAVRDRVYMILGMYDDAGQSAPDAPWKVENSPSELHAQDYDADGTVDDVYFEYNIDVGSIPDGYWELRAVAYNQYSEPGNMWRLRLRIENAAPNQPTSFVASPQLDNETVLLTWVGGIERDRAYYVLQRAKWDGGAWSDSWTTIADHVDANTANYTDQGSIGSETDPWGTVETPNAYQYRLFAVDICEPGKESTPAYAEVSMPPAEITTTTTLVPPPPSTTTTSTTVVSSYSVSIENRSNKSYNLNVRDAGGTLVFTGSVSKNVTRTLDGLSAGNYQITASSPGRPTLTQSFSLPAQAGQIVMTIL